MAQGHVELTADRADGFDWLAHGQTATRLAKESRPTVHTTEREARDDPQAAL